MNSITQVPYLPTTDTETMRLITNTKKLSEELLENIQYSDNPALLSLRQYIQFVSQERLPYAVDGGKTQCPYTNARQRLFKLLGIDSLSTKNGEALCPFIRGMNKKDLHYAMLYDDKQPNFDNFYKKSFDKLEIIKSINKNKLATFYGIFSDPDLDTQDFSDALQMYCMRRKSEVVASGHMAGAMLSRHRPGGAERIFNKDTFSTKSNNFKTEGFSYIAFRALHFDDYGSMRTVDNMKAFMQQFPGALYQLKYVPKFIEFLAEKIRQDREDFVFLDQMDPASIIIHYYEHHLMDKSEDEIKSLKNLFVTDFARAKNELISIVDQTDKKYKIFAEYLRTIEEQNDNIAYLLSPHA